MHSTSFVEFPRGPLSIGGDWTIAPIQLTVGRSTLQALSATDSCRDRLAAFYHWGDRQSLEVAIAIALRHRVNMRLIGKWSTDEGAALKFTEFRAELARARARRKAARTRGKPGRRRTTTQGSSGRTCPSALATARSLIAFGLIAGR